MKIIQAEGQTCNQFWIYSNYIADCLENGGRFSILVPDVLIADYPSFLNNNVVSFPLYCSFPIKLVGADKYLKILKFVLGNKYSKKCLTVIFKIIPIHQYINAGVLCPKSNYKLKYKNQLKHIFSPSMDIQQYVKNIFSTLRRDFDLIIGVHLRFGDYKTFYGGKYFYSLEQYHLVMQKTKALFSNKKIAFFLSSNEKIDTTYFSDCFCFMLPHSSATKDLYGLCISDYIEGPPSTFSGWASFYSDIPIYFIENPEKDFTSTDFVNILDIWE